MASCQRCNNLLPRTVDQCPVCGLLTAVPEPESEAAPSAAPGWATEAAPVPAPSPSLTQRLAPATGVTAPAAVLPPQGAAPAPPSTGPTAQPVAEPTFADQPSSFALPQPISEPVSAPESDEPGIGQYLPPAAQLSNLQQPNFRQAPSPGTASPSPNDDEPADSPAADPIEMDDTRSVRALSARIGGDVRIGKSDHHQAISIGLLGLGIVSLGVGAMISLFALGVEPTFEAVESPTLEAVDDESIATFVETYQGSILEVRADGCGERSSAQGVMPDARTVLVPYSAVLIDPTPVIVTPDGQRVLADVVSADPGADLAILQTRSPIEEVGLGWSGTSQSTSGSSLVTIVSSGPGRYTGTPVTVVDRSRNNDGLIAEIEVSDTSLRPGSAVVDAQGRLVGLVANAGGAVTSAEVLQSKVGTAKASPRTYQAICPEPEPEQELEVDQDG